MTAGLLCGLDDRVYGMACKKILQRYLFYVFSKFPDLFTLRTCNIDTCQMLIFLPGFHPAGKTANSRFYEYANIFHVQFNISLVQSIPVSPDLSGPGSVYNQVQYLQDGEIYPSYEAIAWLP